MSIHFLKYFSTKQKGKHCTASASPSTYVLTAVLTTSNALSLNRIRRLSQKDAQLSRSTSHAHSEDSGNGAVGLHTVAVRPFCLPLRINTFEPAFISPMPITSVSIITQRLQQHVQQHRHCTYNQRIQHHSEPPQLIHCPRYSVRMIPYFPQPPQPSIFATVTQL